MQHVRHLRRRQLRDERVNHRGEHEGEDDVGVRHVALNDVYDAESARGNDYDAVAHKYEPLHVGDGVFGVNELAYDVRAAEGGVVAQHKAEAYARESAARERGEQVVSAFGVPCGVLRKFHYGKHRHKDGIYRDGEEGVEGEFSVQHNESGDEQRDVEDESGD